MVQFLFTLYCHFKTCWSCLPGKRARWTRTTINAVRCLLLIFMLVVCWVDRVQQQLMNGASCLFCDMVKLVEQLLSWQWDLLLRSVTAESLFRNFTDEIYSRGMWTLLRYCITFIIYFTLACPKHLFFTVLQDSYLKGDIMKKNSVSRTNSFKILTPIWKVPFTASHPFLGSLVWTAGSFVVSCPDLLLIIITSSVFRSNCWAFQFHVIATMPLQ